MDNIVFRQENLKIVTHIDLGWTEDEYNNFMIDVFTTLKEDFKEDIIKSTVSGEQITVTLMPEMFNK